MTNLQHVVGVEQIAEGEGDRDGDEGGRADEHQDDEHQTGGEHDVGECGGAGVIWLKPSTEMVEKPQEHERRGGEDNAADDVAGPVAGAREVGVEGGILVGEAPEERAEGDDAADEEDDEENTTLARQASLAVQNARLATELQVRLEEIRETTAELAASRSRIVAAHESARRQIERDIHDGAQQELVALMAGIALARSQSIGEPGRLEETLADLQAEARHALDNLRQLAAGIHPSVLSDHGLVEAIEIRSSRMLIAVTVDCEDDVRPLRFSDEVEGAAYFFVSEALTNTLKHGSANRACIRFALDGGCLEVAVSDDGVGFDTKESAGTGLRGLADRIEAIGGTFDVWSATGRGARLTARIPT